MKEALELNRRITAFYKFNPYCEVFMRKSKDTDLQLKWNIVGAEFQVQNSQKLL